MSNYLLTHTGAQVDEAVSLALAGVQDGSITFAKLNSSVFATPSDVIDGTSSTTLITPAALSESGIISSGAVNASGAVNVIRNPRFAVNQRNVSGTVTLSAGAYGHDGWKAGASGCTYTFSTTQNRTTLTITAGSLVQTVDGRDLAAGANTHTLSWGGSCQGKIGAGSYAASGVTGSATGGTNINVEFGIGTLYEPQFEIGTIASAFDCLPDWLEMERCRKYLPSLSGLYCPLGVGQAISATAAQLSIRFSPRPNATLTGLSISSPSHVQVIQATGNAVSPTGVAFNAGGQEGLTLINFTGLSGLVAGNSCNILSGSASFRLLATGAEL